MRKTLSVIGIILIVIFLTLSACESTPTTTPSPTRTNIIEDLAYIKASGGEYSDDADPEPEGAEITILWYNTKSETIFFDDVPVNITIEIFAAKSDEFPRSFTVSVYKGEHHIDNYQDNIRIPFEQIKANTEIYDWAGKANIVAHTPQQGDFSVEGILVPLCSKPPLKPPPIPAPLPKPLPPPTPAPVPAPAPSPTPQPIVTPNPPTTQEAIAMVRASPQMSDAVVPFKQELEWKAEWVVDRWWVVGLFESPWGVKFVSDATIWDGRVYAYIDYGMRPKHEWVEAKAKEWQLQSLYTRLTPIEALVRVKKSKAVSLAVRDVKIVDEAAELVEDNAIFQTWRFAFYVLRGDGSYIILVVDGLGGNGAEEGQYTDDYGFGNATEAYYDIPLHLSDWAHAVAKAHGWEKVANLP